jgi:ADP-ribose pyrophosphatase YjhB (NUDIX family)
MTPHATFKIRCRAIILHEEKLLVVKHRKDADYYALPGGHLELGESVEEGLVREIVEELGVRPSVGRLLYVHTFEDKDTLQTVEFFFEVLNGAEYLDIAGLERTHAHELAEIRWASPSDGLRILPKGVTVDFAHGSLLSNAVRYTKG